METEIIRHANATILECRTPITGLDDALDLIGACLGGDVDRLLLEAPLLPKDFFDLRTRFAGEFLQKLQNYRIRTAGVIPPDLAYSPRFNEFLTEARRGQNFRVFSSREEALDWFAAS